MGIDKYYVPGIEEFHVGFEFEELINGDAYKNVFGELHTNIDIIQELINDGGVRVKHLDSADIEECGWVLKSEGNVIIFKRNEPRNPNEPEEFLEYWHLNLHEDGTVVVHNAGYYESEIIIFYGKIKNKSELKRLMKQLGIWE